jgi:hypothetical protein
MRILVSSIADMDCRAGAASHHPWRLRASPLHNGVHVFPPGCPGGWKWLGPIFGTIVSGSSQYRPVWRGIPLPLSSIYCETTCHCDRLTCSCPRGLYAAPSVRRYSTVVAAARVLAKKAMAAATCLPRRPPGRILAAGARHTASSRCRPRRRSLAPTSPASRNAQNAWEGEEGLSLEH